MSSRRSGREEKPRKFFYFILDEDGSGDYFETDQAKTDTVTKFIMANATGCGGKPLKFTEGKITAIHYRLNPTNAVTFTLRIWRKGGVAANYASNVHLLYESPAAQADDEDYFRNGLDKDFILATPGKFWYSIDWSGPSGNTPGFIVIEGEVTR